MGLELASEYPHLKPWPHKGRGGPEVVWFPEGAKCRIAKIRRGKYVRFPGTVGKAPRPFLSIANFEPDVKAS